MPVLFSKLFDCCKLVIKPIDAYFNEMCKVLSGLKYDNESWWKSCKRRYKLAPWYYKLINEILVISSIGFAIYKFSSAKLDIGKLIKHTVCGNKHKIVCNDWSGDYTYSIIPKYHDKYLIISKWNYVVSGFITFAPLLFYQIAPIVMLIHAGICVIMRDIMEEN